MNTLTRVTGERRWEGQHGHFVDIDLEFTDEIGEFRAALTTKPETLTKRLEELEELIGTPSDEWAFTDKGTFSDGSPKPKKVVGVPGKAIPTAKPATSDGFRSEPAPFKRDMDAIAFEQERTDRRTALMQAVGFHSGDEAEDVVILREADYFYQWLRAPLAPSTKHDPDLPPPGWDK